MSLRFSVIIPTFRRREPLLRCLRSLAVQTFPAGRFEVIVVDDGSPDGTYRGTDTLSWPFLLTLLREANSGPSAARNLGVSKARGEIVALCEDDVEAHPDWLGNADQYFNDPGVVLVEGATVIKGSQNAVRRFDRPDLHSFIPCNLFVRRETYTRVGGYDPEFYDAQGGLYFREDADLGFRIMETGAGMRIAPDVIVEHPPQFAGVEECFRHVRRYVFDPLLYRKHPALYRQMIEAKRVAGVTFHRPQHYLALVYALSLCAGLGGLLLGSPFSLAVFGALGFVCSIIFRYKYQGARALRLDRIVETVAFLVLPIVYLRSFLNGCYRFKSFGPIL